MIANKVAPSLVPTTPSTPLPVSAPQTVTNDWNFMGYVNPPLDESWTPPPPPTTPADHLHPEREEIANERAAAQLEGS
jgi:hypothetical protein